MVTFILVVLAVLVTAYGVYKYHTWIAKELNAAKTDYAIAISTVEDWEKDVAAVLKEFENFAVKSDAEVRASVARVVGFLRRRL